MARDTRQDDTGEWNPYDTDPYAPYETAPTYPNPQAPTPLNTGPYTGGLKIAGWTPQGSEWVPIYTGSDGRYYTGGGMPWWGPQGSLRTGDGAGSKPTWKPGDTEPANASDTYTDGVIKANAPPPVPVVTGGGGGGSSSSGGGSTTPRPTVGPVSGAAPSFYFPEFQAPQYQAVDPFAAPSLQDAQNEPGYAFAMEQGRKALENSAAARGTLRTGGTFKDLFAWGNQFGEQNYSNVYNRAADAWGMGNKANQDTYDITYKGAQDQFAAKQGAAQLTFEDTYRRWRDALDANTRLATNTGVY